MALWSIIPPCSSPLPLFKQPILYRGRCTCSWVQCIAQQCNAIYLSSAGHQKYCSDCPIILPALYRHSTVQLFKSSIAIKYSGCKHTAQLGVLQSTPSSTASAMALKSLFRTKIPSVKLHYHQTGHLFLDPLYIERRKSGMRAFACLSGPKYALARYLCF